MDRRTNREKEGIDVRSASRWAAVAATAALVLALGAGAAMAQGTEITFWVMPNAADAIHVPWLDQKVEEFYRETGIRVRYEVIGWEDRKSTRLNSSHVKISYA